MAARKIEFVREDGSPFDIRKTIAGTMTITYGEQVENHARMEMIGAMAERGISTVELLQSKKKLEQIYPEVKVEYVDLKEYAPDNLDVEDAGVLIIRDGVRVLGFSPEKMMRENLRYEWDKHALMYGTVRQKHARWNACYSDFDQEPMYADGRGRVVDFKHLPETGGLREMWATFLPLITKGLNAEGNYYYNSNDCGIGWHGDGERKIVIAARLGVSIPLVYHWWHQGKQVGELCELHLEHGDIYVMSEKATGNDWKKKVTPTLRHAAGCEKYTTYKPKKGKEE